LTAVLRQIAVSNVDSDKLGKVSQGHDVSYTSYPSL